MIDPPMDILRLLEAKGIGKIGVTLTTVLTSEMRKGTKYVRAALVSSSTTPDHMDAVDYGTVEITVCGGHGERGREDGIEMAHRVYKELALLCQGAAPPGYVNIRTAGAPQEYNLGAFTVFAFRVDFARYYGG
jgi:hypothetical protein